jgi:hypothetical protein
LLAVFPFLCCDLNGFSLFEPDAGRNYAVAAFLS